MTRTAATTLVQKPTSDDLSCVARTYPKVTTSSLSPSFCGAVFVLMLLVFVFGCGKKSGPGKDDKMKDVKSMYRMVR